MNARSFVFTVTALVASLVLAAGCDAESESSADESGSNPAGDDTPATFDNVAACEEFVASVECGSFDPSTAIQCESFESYPCDVSDYWSCLSDNFTCTDGSPDASKWGQCAELASCS